MKIENVFLEELRKVLDERPRGFQTEIANSLKINRSTFSNMVCGRGGCEEDQRRAVSKLAGIDYDELVRRCPPTLAELLLPETSGRKSTTITQTSGGHSFARTGPISGIGAVTVTSGEAPPPEGMVRAIYALG